MSKLQSVAERLASLPERDRAEALSVLTDAEAEALLRDWRGFLARPDQIEPEGDWDIWLALAGRGWGKTETGANWIKEQAENPEAVIAMIGETAADVNNVMVKRLLSLYTPEERPEHIASKRTLKFKSGAIAYTYNGTEPDQLRGPEHSCYWADEIAKWRYAREAWDQLQFGLRVGHAPRGIVTTTPRPIELIKAIVAGKEGKVHVTRGRTLDNRSNLPARFIDKITQRYAGTRLGRQELEAEILGDLPGALWRQSDIDVWRVQEAPQLERIVVSVDPAVTNTEDSDEHGIVVAGLSEDQTGYLIEDQSVQGSPLEWAKTAIALSTKHQADGVVVEVNQGGDMVAHTLRSVAPNLNVIEVRASRGKHVRAEPVASLYEQGRIRHVGRFDELESQMTQMTNAGFEGDGSPDRVDALVWAFSELFPDMVDAVPDVSQFMAGSSRGWMGR